MKKILFALVVIFSFVLSACGGSSSNVPFPTGTFADTSNQSRGYIFNEDGTWKYFTLGTGTITATGTYKIEGNQFIENGGGSDFCDPATYEWSYDGTTLSFKVVGEDTCSARKASLDGHSFTLK